MELTQKQPPAPGPGTGPGTYRRERGYFERLGPLDWLFAAALVGAVGFALMRFGAYMDVYEKAILVLAAPSFAALGWYWKPLRWLMPVVALLSLWSISMYGGQLGSGETKFFLRYMLSSQSAILWMSTLFVFSTVYYWIGLLSRANYGGSVGSKLCWTAVVLGWTGLMVRWYESYLMGADVGHIPVSNLYEVFILFALITAMFYLYYEQRYATWQLGPFVMLVIVAAIAFLLWYMIAREESADIKPLLPALQSWWMKIHVPANFIGYGSFALSAMVGSAYLLKSYGRLADRLPSLEVLDDVMYKSISVGFAFFTVATILGALWAADAWGTYWQWDPKETWALIVWINYAAWLHMRLITGLRGRVAAWWALVGLLVTTFAFLGVNMFLSGLHSYGAL
jgi:cytochrome c-type biogenesis protein CcsB